MNVLLVAVSPRRRLTVIERAREVLDAGGQVTLITLKGGGWDDLPDEVVVHELQHDEASHPFLRAERAIVLRAPNLTVRALDKGARAIAARRDGMDMLRWTTGSLRERQVEWSQRFHKRKFAKAYSNVRPWLLWRVARQGALERIDTAALDQVVLHDSLSIPIGWHLAQEYPDLYVGFELREVTV
ncbi:MAG TPA: hypothetical protein VJ978_10670 [Nitriliruptoraceae bacterium]|nr:hypothetical protein [Nitriliruptoraceae bacterium]